MNIIGSCLEAPIHMPLIIPLQYQSDHLANLGLGKPETVGSVECLFRFSSATPEEIF